MSEHDEVYGRARAEQLVALLHTVSDRIRELDREGRLLDAVPELIRLLGEARSELFHYEVRQTYDTPEVAESRRIVEEAQQTTFLPETSEEPEEDEPWRGDPPE